jgi:UDP:flavonoid glycosyltransferase YjiC (YdhE family)
MLNIARELKRRGHTVVTCVPQLFRPVVERLGLCGLCYSEDSTVLMRNFGADWKAARYALGWLARSIDEQLAVLDELCQGADALVTTAQETAAPTVAEARGLAHFRVVYAPMIPGDQPPPLQPFQRLPRWANRALWTALNVAIHLLFGRKINRERRRRGLAPSPYMADYLARNSHTLLAFSPRLGPPAAGWKYPYTYVGYCHGQDDGALEPGLRAFLAAGPPPVYVGFGSVSVAHPQRFGRMLVEAAARARCRVIIGKGWTGLAHHDPGAGRNGDHNAAAEGNGRRQVYDHIYVANTLPHAAVFPQLSAAAHHGGSGTLHNAARAGLPQFIMPQIADQFYWGHRVACLGVGPRPVPPARLNVSKLAAALASLTTNRRMQAEARRLAALLRADERPTGGADASSASDRSENARSAGASSAGDRSENARSAGASSGDPSSGVKRAATVIERKLADVVLPAVNRTLGAAAVSR